jgi:hypothetical protein
MLIDGYIDPGSGSLIVQAIVAGVAAAGVMMRFYGRRLLTFLRIRKPEAKIEE